MKISILLITSLLLIGTLSSDEGCKNVSISTGLKEDGEFSFDIMDKGDLNSYW